MKSLATSYRLWTQKAILKYKDSFGLEKNGLSITWNYFSILTNSTFLWPLSGLWWVYESPVIAVYSFMRRCLELSLSKRVNLDTPALSSIPVQRRQFSCGMYGVVNDSMYRLNRDVRGQSERAFSSSVQQRNAELTSFCMNSCWLEDGETRCSPAWVTV